MWNFVSVYPKCPKALEQSCNSSRDIRKWSIWQRPLPYSPLIRKHDFRLLRLHDAPLSGRITVAKTITCSLEVVSFEDNLVAYKALSYEWNPRPQDQLFRQKKILVDGHHKSIGSNLYDALCQVYATYGPSVLWIDALCINQDDEAEKSQQIYLMRRIYSKASEVWVWLGTERIAAPDDLDTGRLPSHALARKIENRSYWTRVWIIQELLLAKEVVLMGGDTTCLWAKICDEAYYSKPYNSKSPMWDIITLQRKYNKIESFTGGMYRKLEETKLTLIEAIQHASNAHASRQEDLVWGVIGLVDEQELGGLVPDTRLSPCEVFSRVLQIVSAKDWLPGYYRTNPVLKELKHRPIEKVFKERIGCDGSCGTKLALHRYPKI